MTLSNTSLVRRLHARYCNLAWRLRLSSRLMWLCLSGRVGRRARCVWRHQPARGSAGRQGGVSPGAGAIYQPPRALGGKAMDPFAQRRIGQGQRLGDRLEALPLDDVADRLGATEDPGLLGPLQEGI